jgi:flagellar M-ring protein FliF
METGNQSFLKQFGALWSRIGAAQQLIVVALAIILIAGFAIWIGVAKKPAYALLYGELNAVDAGRIITELQTQNVKYELSDGGKSILVPAEKVDELRIGLASGGFSPTGVTGYEILDKTQLGMSDLLQRTNQKRAMEGELARTLMSLKEVSAARVHLTLPEPSPFIAEQVEPSASVVLELTPPGIKLDRERIAAVRTFVAGAINTKNLDGVTIIDQNMNLLSGPVNDQPGALQPSQEEARRTYEMEKAASIRTLLERAYGVGKVAVSFSCIMDFDQVQTESLDYKPITGSEHGVIVSEEQNETSSKGENASGGVPGTESNIPSYPSSKGQANTTKTSTETKNYDVSQSREVRTKAPGTVKSASVSVMIDSTGKDEILPSEKTEVEKLVSAAAGINAQTGDTLTVAFRNFDTSLQDELKQAKSDMSSGNNLKIWLSAVLGILAIGIFLWVLKNFTKPLEGVMAGAGPVPDEEVVFIPSVELPITDPEILEKLRVREEIEKLIKEDPAGAAKVIKTWLQE